MTTIQWQPSTTARGGYVATTPDARLVVYHGRAGWYYEVFRTGARHSILSYPLATADDAKDGAAGVVGTHADAQP